MSNSIVISLLLYNKYCGYKHFHRQHKVSEWVSEWEWEKSYDCSALIVVVIHFSDLIYITVRIIRFNNIIAVRVVIDQLNLTKTVSHITKITWTGLSRYSQLPLIRLPIIRLSSIRPPGTIIRFFHMKFFPLIRPLHMNFR